MIVDTSAIVAILRDEPEARKYYELIKASSLSYLPAPLFLELCMVVISGRSPDAEYEVLSVIEELGIKLIEFTPTMAKVATKSFIKYGKGRGHPAQLNFGDCISYATSKVEAMPLLFKGDDFRLTDVEAAL